MSVLTSDEYYTRGGDTGCLLVHGFSGSPSELRPLADALVARGYTVRVPLLPGHGSTPDHIGSVTWHDWRDAFEAARNALERECSRIVLIGYSMGGNLAILAAARQPPAALVLLAVPTFIGDWRLRLLPVARYVVPWWYPLERVDFSEPAVRERVLRNAPGADLDDPLVQQDIRRSVRIPTRAIDQFFRVMRYARRRIRSVAAPALIVHGRQDRTAVPACAEELYRDLAGPVKQLAWFDQADHELIAGAQGGAVVEQIVEWLAARVGEPAA